MKKDFKSKIVDFKKFILRKKEIKAQDTGEVVVSTGLEWAYMGSMAFQVISAFLHMVAIVFAGLKNNKKAKIELGEIALNHMEHVKKDAAAFLDFAQKYINEEALAPAVEDLVDHYKNFMEILVKNTPTDSPDDEEEVAEDAYEDEAEEPENTTEEDIQASVDAAKNYKPSRPKKKGGKEEE